MVENKSKRTGERPLEPEELEERRRVTTQAMGHVLSSGDHWSAWITGVYIFGSTARGEATTSSDVDVAVISCMGFLTTRDRGYMTHLLSQAIKRAREELGLREDFAISPEIIQQTWLEDPDSAGLTNPQAVKDIKKDGVKII